MIRAAIDQARALLSRADADTLTPRAVHFLLREYVANGDAAIRDQVERGITRGLALADTTTDLADRFAWIRVLADAGAVSDDERVREAVARSLPPAVDALESFVRTVYEPGNGLLDRSCAEHLRCSVALLTAFDLSGRLPYGMLAEELLQHARRRWWREADAVFDADLPGNSSGLHVVCRLIALHADADYRAAAVVARSPTYSSDARRLADWISRQPVRDPQLAGDTGGALLDWFALEPNLQ